MDSSVFTVLMLMLGVLLRVGLIATVAWFVIPRRQRCPHCRETTLRLVTPAVMMNLRLERRWCPCGWEGLSKRVRADQPEPVRQSVKP